MLAAETIKFALIEPLSGPFANIGNNSMHSFMAEFERINSRGGVLGRNFELVAFDNKSNPQDSALQVQAAIDRDIRYILQAAGSNNGHAVNEAVAKHNARNPDRAVLYLNFGALDPAITTEKCQFWHFRFVPHGHMIMAALTDAVARNGAIKRVYLIDQDYVWGRSVAVDAREMLAQAAGDSDRRRRPSSHWQGQGLRALRGGESRARRCHRDRTGASISGPADQGHEGSRSQSRGLRAARWFAGSAGDDRRRRGKTSVRRCSGTQT